MLWQSNVSQCVLQVANALEPRNTGIQIHPSDPADRFVFDKLVFFRQKGLIQTVLPGCARQAFAV